MPSRKPLSDDPFRQTLADVAAWLGVSKGAVEEWNQTDGSPRKSKKGYNCREWAVWIVARRTKSSDTNSPDHKLKVLKVEREQFDLDRLRERLIAVEDARSRFTLWARAVVKQIESGPAEMSAALAGKSAAEVRKGFQAWVDGVRQKIHDSPLKTNAELKALSGE